MLPQDDNRPPVPPADLILRVTPPFNEGDLEQVRRSFDIEGLNHLRVLERALNAALPWTEGETPFDNERMFLPRSFADFDRLLEFGCGCGRFLRHLGPVADQVEIHGTDIDAEMIEWLRANLPFGSYEVAPHEPPLPYPDHHFDLVINHSVFSHLDEHYQDMWLAELQRVTRPGALLLLTVEGQSSWARTRAASQAVGEDFRPWEDELETRGILFIENDSWVGSTHPDFYHSTVHATWYVLEHWSQFFNIEAYLIDGAWSQDLVVCRRRADGAPPPAQPIGRKTSPASEPTPATQPRMGLREVAAASLRQRLDRVRQRAPSPSDSGGSDQATQDLVRELGMLRMGLYEQGRRISVLAEQLRDEIRSIRSLDGHE